MNAPAARHGQRPVTVSIVSHGHGDLVRPLLQQLSTWCAASIERVRLTLNIPEALALPPALRFPVEVLRNARPRGFGANHNAALQDAASPWLLVLNPDISLEGDVLSQLLARAETGSGLVVPRVLEPGRSEPEPFRALVTPLELYQRRRSAHRPPPWPSWTGGMFMLVRRQAWLDVGGFDERFFMYCEDVDLCLRLQLAGCKLQVVMDAFVRHAAARASHGSARAFGWHIASLARLWTAPAFWRYLRLQRRWRGLGASPLVLLSSDIAAHKEAWP